MASSLTPTPRSGGTYLPRLLDPVLADRLAAAGAVVIEGAKATGKTETARHCAASEVLFDVDKNARLAAEIDPAVVLAGETPRLLDEWQLVPSLWNAVRRDVDAHRDKGRFILTGSSTPADDEARHTGAGRISRLRIRPMTLVETGVSSGDVSLADLFAGGSPAGSDRGLDLPAIVEVVARGGWPATIGLTTPQALRAVRDYAAEIFRGDIHTVDGVIRDPLRVQAVMAALARNIATQVADTTIATDARVALQRENQGNGVAAPTVRSYLDALERLMVLEPQPAWAPHLRSRARLRTTPKTHFVDPSLAVALLGASPVSLTADLNAFGYLFESLVVRDLRVYAGVSDGEVLHYRDSNGREADAIVTTWDGRWGAVEVKLGSSASILDAAAERLRGLISHIDTTRSGEPAFLAVVTGMGYAYRRPDGVCVVPIGTLRP